jgi:hypothetical protein
MMAARGLLPSVPGTDGAALLGVGAAAQGQAGPAAGATGRMAASQAHTDAAEPKEPGKVRHVMD